MQSSITISASSEAIRNTVVSFKSVQSKIAKKSKVSKERAGAILAAATRRASPAAKRKNPKLKKVK